MQYQTHLQDVACIPHQTAADGILERLYAEQRLARLNHTFLQFTANALDNINRLTACCGELLQADCALYNRLVKDRLTVIGCWNAPPDLPREDSAAGHICCDVIAMTKTLGMDVIAEGVEQPEQVTYLLNHECPNMQGFFFNRPLDKTAMTKLLAA